MPQGDRPAGKLVVVGDRLWGLDNVPGGHQRFAELLQRRFDHDQLPGPEDERGRDPTPVARGALLLGRLGVEVNVELAERDADGDQAAPGDRGVLAGSGAVHHDRQRACAGTREHRRPPSSNVALDLYIDHSANYKRWDRLSSATAFSQG